jgi:GDP-mannose 6-dehydrogenase
MLDGEHVLGIVGLTFKPGTDDLRESPSLRLLKKLKLSGKRVYFHDPCVTRETRLDPDPRISDLLQTCRSPDAVALSQQSDRLLITHDSDHAVAAVVCAGPDKKVLDVVRSERVRKMARNYQGICW